MKILSANCYELEDLMDLAIEEGNLMTKWLEYEESKTLKIEKKIVNVEEMGLKKI